MSEKGRYVGSYPVIMVVVSKENELKRKVNVLIVNTCPII
jgi:radical SAM superfamily enzyme with C-terminal helix-hairpin-helix motif